MDTRDVLLVDAFTDEPTAGTPVGVVPDGADLAADQRAAIASEFAAPATAFLSDIDDGYRLRVAGRESAGPDLDALVGTTTALAERETLPGDLVLETDDGRESVALEDGIGWVEVDRPELRDLDASEETVADALGVDVAALRDVGADLPMARGSLGAGVVLVPVNFLEHVSGMDPDPGAIADLLAAENADSIYAFTFDTLDGANQVHARTVGRGVSEAWGARPAPGGGVTGSAAVCCGFHCRRHGVFDGERDRLRFEQGDFRDRPARIRIDLAHGRVGGRGVTVLDGSVVVPPADEGGDIIEA